MAKTNLSVMAGVARTPPGRPADVANPIGPGVQVARQRSRAVVPSETGRPIAACRCALRDHPITNHPCDRRRPQPARWARATQGGIRRQAPAARLAREVPFRRAVLGTAPQSGRARPEKARQERKRGPMGRALVLMHP